MKNAVIFKGFKDGIAIVLSEDYTFVQILDELQKKIDDSKKYFGGNKTNIKILGRDLTKDEEEQVFHIITTSANLDISFIGSEKYFSHKPTEKIVEKVVEKIVEVAVPTQDTKKFTAKKNETYFHKGTLRSGDSIKFEGSVVVLGDTNPGSEIIAHGNIIVQGKISGFVHAGCTGDYNCYISAFNLSPTQLRIADKLTAIPEKMLKENKKSFIPRQACIEDNEITIKNILKKF